jgi:hypothetical protein
MQAMQIYDMYYQMIQCNELEIFLTLKAEPEDIFISFLQLNIL